MAQFDVFKTSYADAPLVLDIQANLLRGLKTRVVIPLERAEGNSFQQLNRLHPGLEINGEPYILNTAEMSVVAASYLEDMVYSLGDDHRQTIIEAVDFLVHGYRCG